MMRLVEALHYHPYVRGFDSCWYLKCFIDTILPVTHCCGVDSASNRNEYQEYFLGSKCGRCVRLTTVPQSCADCLEIWEPQPPDTL